MLAPVRDADSWPSLSEHLSLERMDPDFVPEIRWYDANGRMVRKDVIAPHDAETIASLCEHRGLIRSPNRRWIAD